MQTMTISVRLWRSLTNASPAYPNPKSGTSSTETHFPSSRQAIWRVFTHDSDVSSLQHASTTHLQPGEATSTVKQVHGIASQPVKVEVLSRRQLRSCPHWRNAFASQPKDHRYYEIVEDTIHPEFDYWYFAVRAPQGEIRAIQPFFILDQDILAGLRPYFQRCIDAVRLQWPRFMYMKTLMVGCVAGEGQLDEGNEQTRCVNAEVLAVAIIRYARDLRTQLIVLKEFPERDRRVLSCFVRAGFTRIPSMPHTLLNIEYASFDHYMQSALNSATRRKLRKKFRVAQLDDVAIELNVCEDVTLIINEIYPLYLQVYERSQLRFEKLTKEYFCRLGKQMPDKVRFFVWRRNGKAVAFGECLVHDNTMFAEYIGLDYSVALELHLYHYVFPRFG